MASWDIMEQLIYVIADEDNYTRNKADLIKLKYVYLTRLDTIEMKA